MILELRRIRDFQVHPLGFYYLVLAKGEFTSRLHVYLNSGNIKADNDWHTHEFSLQSRVLLGGIKNYVGGFDVSSAGSVQEFQVGYEGNLSVLSPTLRSGEIDTLASFETSAGSNYFLKEGQIHRVECLDVPCVTLVKMRHTGAPIFSYGDPEVPFDRRSIDCEEGKRIEAALRMCSGIELRN